MKKTIWFDLDGTLVNLYGVQDWLPMIQAYDPTPYAVAKPLVRFSHLARLLNMLQGQGYNIGIISWLAKNSTAEYDGLVAETKRAYLRKRLPSVRFDTINIVPYGTLKDTFNNGFDFLFDDEEQNRENWTGEAYDAKDLIAVLQEMVRG